MTHRISVVIPTFNRAPFLTQAIESVRRQSCAPHEIIIVDDGSTDDTREVVRGYGDTVRYFYQENRGPAAARNLALAHAQGDLVTFLDDDDIWLPHALELGMARLQDPSAPVADMVFGLTLRATNIKWSGTAYSYTAVPPVWTIMSFCTLLCRRNVFTRVGLLDENLSYGEDVDWFLRVREQKIRFVFLPHVTHLYRMHDSNMTNRREHVHRFFLQAIKQSLERRATENGGTVADLPDIADAKALRRNLDIDPKSISYSDPNA